MEEKKYVVKSGESVLAENMNLIDALLFIEAYINKYYMEYTSLTICTYHKSKSS